MSDLNDTLLESPFGRLFLAIQDRIKEKVPGIRWIDMESGQLENYGDRPAVLWPCLLIDFPDCGYEDMTEVIQEADGLVQLRLAFPPFSATSGNTPIAYKDKALKYLELENEVYKALHGIKLDGFGYLMRKSAKTEQREGDSIRVRDLRFSIVYEDHNAKPVYQKRKPGPLHFTVQLEWPSAQA